MKRCSKALTATGFIGAFVLIGALVAVAQQGTQADTTARSTDSQVGTTDANRGIGKLDEHTSGANIRASQLIGMNIENSKGDNVGEINDLVIDGKSGRIRYAAVTYGGFLGVGSKMFAVPFEAFQVRQDRDNRDEYVLTLNVTKDQLEGAEGFDEENWPNFADANFARELDRRYNIDRRRYHAQDRGGVEVDIRTGRTPGEERRER